MSDPILEEALESFSGSSICALCGNMVGDDESHRVVAAHGGKFLVHADCLAMLYEEEEEEE